MPKPDLRCYIATASDVVGGRWKAAIVWHLLRDAHFYGELRRLVPGASQRMMTLSLRDLERDGVVQRIETATGRVRRVRYQLTPIGRSLERVIEELFAWGDHYRASVAARGETDALVENRFRSTGNAFAAEGNPAANRPLSRKRRGSARPSTARASLAVLQMVKSDRIRTEMMKFAETVRQRRSDIPTVLCPRIA